MASQKLCKHDEIKKRSTLTKDGNPVQYHLKTTNLDQSNLYRKMTFGERDYNKPHKTILMVGETGTGKTTLVNVMVNHMLGVQREDKVWFQITDDQSDRSQAHSQTKIITVYGFYPQESLIDLTIIDTPGYGDLKKEITLALLNLLTLEEDQKIDAVCLVMNSTQNRPSDRLRCIFDAVQFLFGEDIAENMVLLFTHSNGARPKNALKIVKEAEIKFAVDDKNQPVFFLFNNCQSDAADEEDEDDDYDDEECEQRVEQSWNQSFKRMKKLLNFLEKLQPKTLQMTQDVLQKQKQLFEFSNLLLRVKMIEQNQDVLKQTKKALDQNKEYVKDSKDFEYEVDVPFKEEIPISPEASKAVMCCFDCKENCVYSDSGWVSDLSWFIVNKDNHCTVCTNRCPYNKHVEAKIYEIKTQKEKRKYEDLKKKYEKIGDDESIVTKLKIEGQELKLEKVKHVFDAFYCVVSLEKITVLTGSLILQHIDYLIEELKVIHEPEKAKKLEDIKKRAALEHTS